MSDEIENEKSANEVPEYETSAVTSEPQPPFAQANRVEDKTIETPDVSEKRSGMSLTVVALVLLVAIMGGAIGAALVRFSDDANSTAQKNEITQIVTTSDIKSVLKKVEPAVVSINTNSIGVGSAGSGTGVILNPEGEVLTNAHVVNGGTSFSVALFDEPKKPIPADLIGTNPSQDLALLKLRNPNKRQFPSAKLGNSDAIEVGDPVIAIGNALALAGSPSVTTGIISAKNRTINTQTEKLENLLQTDAAINFGNSGGPLVNMNAEVIGINTATADPSYSQNIGFSIPINSIQPQLKDLRAGKNNSNQALLGVTSITLTPDLRLRYSLEPQSGAVVTAVQPNSPASVLKLEELDIIVGVDGKEISSSQDLVNEVRRHKPGDQVKIEWYRGTERKTGTTELVARPAGLGR